MKKKLSAAILFFTAFIVLIPLVSSRFHARIDMTDNKIYTLTPYTRKILSSLDSEVKITWYRSAALSQLTPAFRTIEDCLDEYRASSGGFFSFSITDPGSNATGKELDVPGIVPRQIEIREHAETVTKNVYSGLLVEHNGSSRVIPFLADQTTLEYDLTRFILEMEDTPENAAFNNKAVTIIYGNAAGESHYPYVIPWLSYAGFTVNAPALPVQSLDTKEGLIVIGSTNIDPATADAISVFLDAGGNAVFFVSGTNVNVATDWKAVPKTQDRILSVLAQYGIGIEPNLVLDTDNWQLTMPSIDKTTYETIRYPFWVRASGVNHPNKSMILNGMDSIQFYWPSSIILDTTVNASLYPLIESSGSSITTDEPFITDPFKNQLALIEKSNSKAPARLAVTSSRKGRIICVADEHCVSSMIDNTGSDSNLTLMVNSAEWITGKDKLLELKKMPASLEPVTAEELSSIAAYFHAARIVMLVILPLAVVISFLIIFAVRRKKR